jgi:hypothetical protein
VILKIFQRVQPQTSTIRRERGFEGKLIMQRMKKVEKGQKDASTEEMEQPRNRWKDGPVLLQFFEALIIRKS